MGRRKIPESEIHKGIAEAIRLKNREFDVSGKWRQRGRVEEPEEFRLSSEHWQKSRKPVVDGRSLNNWYQLVRSRIVNGEPYFGHGSWDKYLEKQHGVVPMHQGHWSDERIHVTIARQLEKQANVSARHWNTNTKPVAADGKSLKNLYQLARIRRGKEGGSFFDHRSWEGYKRFLEKNYVRKTA